MLESIRFPRGPSMYGINYQQSVYMLAVSALSVDPRPTGSQTGRQLCQVVGPAVRQLDWGMKVVEGVEGCAFRTQDVDS